MKKDSIRESAAWSALKEFVASIGSSRLIVSMFFILLLLLTTGQELPGTITNILNRVGMHGVLVLAMVPSIRAGLGPNFAVPFGILAGLLGGLIPIELRMSGMPAFLLAAGCAILLSIPCGLLYGFLMNRVRKSEMMVATYFGYAIVALMCIGWLVAPFQNEAITWSMGTGLRNTITLEDYFGGALSNILALKIDYAAGDVLKIPSGFLAVILVTVLVVYLSLLQTGRVDTESMDANAIELLKAKVKRNRRLGAGIILGVTIICAALYLLPAGGIFLQVRNALTFTHTLQSATQMEIPTGMLLFLFGLCFLMWMYNQSKTGIAMNACGANAEFVRASGLPVNRYRMIGAIMSNVLVSVGILVYAQAFGFLQLYNAPITMTFPPIAAILIGGASIREAKVSHVLIGVLLFQGILTMGPTIAGRYLAGLAEGVDPTEIVRIIITNGIILYALAKAGGQSHAE